MAAHDEVDVCESWEEIIEDLDNIGLERKLNKFLPVPSPSDGQTSSAAIACRLVVDDSASLGPQFMMSEPSIKILKRPSSSNSLIGNGEARSRPVKTLEQRQREYEEARLRILGEARSPEDVLDENLTRLQDKLQANNLSDVAGTPASPLPERLARPRPAPPGVLILRAPRAPDGTRGFVARR